MGIVRNFFPSSYYHIISRGNNKQEIFLHKRNFQRYIYYLEKYSEKFSIAILAFCLMPNHTHLLVKQKADKTVSDFMQSLHTAYTMYFNFRFSRTGHLFQGPYKHVLIETDEYLTHLSRYIHLNPSSAKLVLRPQDWQWSSYRSYLKLEPLNFVSKDEVMGLFSKINPVKDYKEFVDSRVDYQKEISLQKLFLE